MHSIGQIPENFSLTDVYSVHVDTLPGSLVGRRAAADELIWDADGGFADNWKDKSSLEGNVDDGYTFILGRRAFSAAGLPLFASTPGGGGGGSGDATSIQGTDVSVTDPTDGQILKYDAGTDTIEWVDDSGGGGSGDVVGPSSAIDGRIALFDGTTGKLIKQSTETPASILTASEAYTDAAIASAPSGGWQRYCDFNFTQMANQSGITDGLNTIGGKSMRGGNIAGQASVAIVNGTGLVFTTTTTTSNFWFYTGHTCPWLGIDAPVDIPGWIIDHSRIRISCEFYLTVGTANYATCSWGLSRAPFLVNDDWVCFMRDVYSGGSIGVFDFHLYGATEDTGLSLPNNHIGCVSMRSQHQVRWQSKVWAGVDTDTNDVAFDLKTMPIVAQTETATTSEAKPGLPRIKNTDHFLAGVFAQSGNASNDTVCTYKRLRIEYQL